MTKYTDIIERLEKATGPDRELDARIWAFLAGVKYVGHYQPYADDSGRTQVVYCVPPKRKTEVTNPPRMQHAEPVTSSIDAAIALLEQIFPQENCYGFEKDPLGIAAFVSRNDVSSGHWFKEAYAPTAPLAILLATFRALEAQEAAQ